jgi:hypothetical protein
LIRNRARNATEFTYLHDWLPSEIYRYFLPIHFWVAIASLGHASMMAANSGPTIWESKWHVFAVISRGAPESAPLAVTSREFSEDFVVVRFLSSPLRNPGFPRGFSHFWPIALELSSAHAGSVLGACGVVFRVAHRKSSRFSSRECRRNTGDLHVTVWPGLV